MHRIIPVLLLLIFSATQSGCPGCPPPSPDSTLGKIINCENLGVQAIPLIPKVNDCLTGSVNWQNCLIGLINPAVNITLDVIACVTRDQGMKFAESADDPLENRGACRADSFITDYVIKEQGMNFTDNYTSPSNIDRSACSP